MAQEIQLTRPPRGVDASVLIVAVLALTAATLYRNTIIGPARDGRAFDGAVRVRIPSGWIEDKDPNVYTIRRPALGQFSPTVSIARLEIPESGATPTIVDLELARIGEERASSGVGYRVLEGEDRNAFGGNRSAWTRYALVRDPPGTTAEDAVMPVVIDGFDVLVVTKKRHLFHVAAWLPADSTEDDREALANVLDKIRIE